MYMKEQFGNTFKMSYNEGGGIQRPSPHILLIGKYPLIERVKLILALQVNSANSAIVKTVFYNFFFPVFTQNLLIIHIEQINRKRIHDQKIECDTSKFFSVIFFLFSQCVILLLFLLFSQIKWYGQNSNSPPLIKKNTIITPHQSTQVFFIYFFTKKNSLLEHTLRPTCKFLILAIFYHAKKINEHFVYKKFNYINS